jgi:CHAT domain-containing protein
MMMSDLVATVKESKFLREQAKYEEALQKIISFQENVPLSVQQTRVIQCEKAGILYVQGYMQRCEIVLKEALSQSTSSFDGQGISKEEHSWHDLLRGKEALVRMETNGWIEQGLEVRKELVRRYLNEEGLHQSYDDLKVHNDLTLLTIFKIEQEYICARILYIACLFTDMEDEKSKTCSRFEDLFDFLVSQRPTSLTTQLITTYLNLLDERNHPIEIVERILRLEHLQPATKGNISVALARHAGSRQKGLVSCYLSKAEGNYAGYASPLSLEARILGHSHQSLDLDRAASGLRSLMEECLTARIPKLVWQAYAALLKIIHLQGSPNVNGSPTSLDLFDDSRRTALNCAQDIGARLSWCLIFVHSLMYEVRAKRYGRVLEGEGFLKSEMMVSVPYIEGRICQALAFAYYGVGNTERCQHWCEKAGEQAHLAQNKEISSDTTGMVTLLSHFTSQEETSDQLAANTRLDSYANFERRALLEIQTDSSNRHVENAFHKILTLVAQASEERIEGQRQKIHGWLSDAQSLAEQHPNSEEAVFRLEGARINSQYRMEADTPENLIPSLRRVLQFHITRRNMQLTGATFVDLGQLQFAAAHKSCESTKRRRYLYDATESFCGAYTSYQKIETGLTMAYCQVFLAQIQHELAQMVGQSEQKGYYKQGLEHLTTAEALFSKCRQAMSAEPPLQALHSKHCMSRKPLHKDIYRMGIGFSILSGVPTRAWEWIQSFKARSLSDLMGLGSILPPHLEERIREEPPALALWEEESQLLEDFNSKPPESRLNERIRLEKLVEEMKGFPVLDEVLALREGRPEKVQDLDWLFKMSQNGDRRIFVVDWLCQEDGIRISILNSALDPQFSFVPIRSTILKAQVNEWRTDRFEPHQPWHLDKLIEPLEALTKEGDLLVFCPSGPLHRLPLHAMTLPSRRILIERNPVVYCSSLSVVHQCAIRSSTRCKSSSPNDFVSSILMGVYDDTDKERLAVQQTLHRYADWFGGTAIVGDDVTKESFANHATNARLVHFHGHCTGDRDSEILDQALELSHGNRGRDSALPSKNEERVVGCFVRVESNRRPDADHMTVRDIFSLRLNAPVVTLIACSSAHQKVMETGDEPLGLVSAFLYAGATSVVGTLWDTRVVTGRSFSDGFYTAIQEQMTVETHNDSENRLVDLAIAYQHAILKILRNPKTKTPYHWAGFVLHGAWMVKPF